MAFQINVGNPMAGGTSFLVGYLEAKKRAEAQEAAWKAERNQRMADTIGGAIGNVGGAYAQGVARRYEMDWQNQREKARDDRRFAQQQQLEKYRSDLDKDETYFELSGGMTQDEGLKAGRQMYATLPPEMRAELAAELGVDPSKPLPDDSPVYKSIPVRMRQMQAANAYAQQRDDEYARRLEYHRLKAEQEREAAQVQGFQNGELQITDPATDAALRQEYSAVLQMQGSDDYTRAMKMQAMQNLNQKIHGYLPVMKPVQKPPKTQEELIANGDVVPAMYNGKQIGVYTRTAKGKGQVEYKLEKFDKEGSQPIMQPTYQPPVPVKNPDGSMSRWNPKKGEWEDYQPPKPVETPEQKQQTEAEKEAQKVAFEAANLTIDATTADGKKYKRPATRAEKGEYIRDFYSAKDEAKSPNPDAPPLMPVLPADAEGWTPGERVKNFIDTGRSPADVEDLISVMTRDPWGQAKAQITAEQAGQLRRYAREYRASKGKSFSPSAPPFPAAGAEVGKIYTLTRNGVPVRVRYKGGDDVDVVE